MVPELDVGILIGMEPRGDGYALHFERAVILISGAAALALRYVLDE